MQLQSFLRSDGDYVSAKKSVVVLLKLITTGVDNGKQVNDDDIYDTLSGRILASYSDTDKSTNFTPTKVKDVTFADYSMYVSSLGL